MRESRSSGGHSNRRFRVCRRRIHERKSLEAEGVVAEAGKGAVGAGELGEYLGRKEEVRLLPHSAEQVAEHEPAGAGFARSLLRLREALDAPAQVGNRAFFLG